MDETTQQAKHGKKEETITLSKTQLWQIITGLLGVALVASVFTGGFGIGDNSTTQELALKQVGAAPAVPSAPSQPTAAKISFEGVRSMGDEDAPVVIVEYSDFQCPFCSRFYGQTLDQIKTEYIDTGKVKFVYKDFPLDSIHPQATPAALAGWCAEEQGKFWEYHDRIFENQQSLSDSSYKQWAKDLDLDTGKFNDCLDTKKYQSNVQKELAEGSSNGIRGTPGFLIDGQLVSGAQPFTVFQTAIESALAS